VMVYALAITRGVHFITIEQGTERQGTERHGWGTSDDMHSARMCSAPTREVPSRRACDPTSIAHCARSLQRCIPAAWAQE